MDVRRKRSAAFECLIVPEPVNPQGGSPPETDDGAQAQVDWQVDLVEQRRQGREQELWGIPAISVAAQAFLFTTGLEAGTSPAARIILAVVGLLTAVGSASSFDGWHLLKLAK
jgi:hypothetical protein